VGVIPDEQVGQRQVTRRDARPPAGSQLPSEGEAGTAYWYWKIQLAALVELQVAGAPWAVMSWLFTCVTLAADDGDARRCRSC
jgi:hypothetical protein